MKIGIASDHRGFKLKEQLVKYFKKNNITIIDYGTDSIKSVDYTDYAVKLSEAINAKEINLGCLICGSGIGICMAANKIKGIRCAKVDNVKEVFYTKNDNDANMISFSGETSFRKAKKMIVKFLETPFSNEERHVKRIKKMEILDER